MAKAKGPNSTGKSDMLDAEALLSNMKVMAEQSLSVAQANYARAKEAADEFQDSVSKNVDTVSSQTTKLSMTAIEKMKENADEAFDHLQKISSVKSISEAMELQTSYLRQQAEKAVQNVNEMQEAAKQAAQAMAQPLVDAAEKAMKNKD